MEIYPQNTWDSELQNENSSEYVLLTSIPLNLERKNKLTQVTNYYQEPSIVIRHHANLNGDPTLILYNGHTE